LEETQLDHAISSAVTATKLPREEEEEQQKGKMRVFFQILVLLNF